MKGGLLSAATALAVTVAACIAALLADIALGTFVPFATAAAAALVVASHFAFRAVDGLLSLGLLLLLSETVEHWLGLDLRGLDEIALLLLLGIAVVRHGAPNGRLRIGFKEGALVLLLASAVLSSLVAAVPPDIWLPGTFLLLKGIAFFYLVSWLRVDVVEAERIGVAVIGAAVVIGVLGILELMDRFAFQEALRFPPFAEVRGELTVVKSIFLHPAAYGWITAFASLLLYARFIVRRDWWALPVAIALNVATVFSGRRAPVLGVLASLAVGLAWQVRRAAGRVLLRVWGPVVIAVVVLVVVFLPLIGDYYRATVTQYVAPPEQIDAILDDDPETTPAPWIAPRTALYVGSVPVARDHFPLGAGVGRFGSYMSRVEYSPLYAQYGLDDIVGLRVSRPNAVVDTFWPMVLGETGIIGLLAALGFFGGVLFQLWRTVGAASSTAMRVVALAALLVYVESLVRSLVSAVYVAPPIAYFVLGAAGLAVAARATLATRP